jgi:hypothetical protein
MFNEIPLHAEECAINNLIKKKQSSDMKRLKPIDILVIRVNKSKQLKNSKPCARCVTNMLTLPAKAGYYIKYVYYSNDRGTITRIKLSHLSEKKEQHISGYYKHHGYVSKVLSSKLASSKSTDSSDSDSDVETEIII